MNEYLESNDKESLSARTEEDLLHHNFLAEIEEFTNARKPQFSHETRATGIVSGLPMLRPGDTNVYTTPSNPEQQAKPKEEQAQKSEEQEYHKRQEPEIETPLGPGIITRPDKWFDPKEFSNPFNPIWS